MWMLAHPHVSGLYNFGTGRAQSLQELAEATFHAMGKEPNIRFIDMPEHLKKKYQYYTKAEMGKLRKAGCDHAFKSVEDGVNDYVINHLMQQYQTY